VPSRIALMGDKEKVCVSQGKEVEFEDESKSLKDDRVRENAV